MVQTRSSTAISVGQSAFSCSLEWIRNRRKWSVFFFYLCCLEALLVRVLVRMEDLPLGGIPPHNAEASKALMVRLGFFIFYVFVAWVLWADILVQRGIVTLRRANATGESGSQTKSEAI
jgi:hypothetical protein